jgi:hypothetical protein
MSARQSTLTRPAVAARRQLKPEIAARWAEQARAGQLQELYQKPIAELSPAEIARMKAAFFRG